MSTFLQTLGAAALVVVTGMVGGYAVFYLIVCGAASGLFCA